MRPRMRSAPMEIATKRPVFDLRLLMGIMAGTGTTAWSKASPSEKDLRLSTGDGPWLAEARALMSMRPEPSVVGRSLLPGPEVGAETARRLLRLKRTEFSLRAPTRSLADLRGALSKMPPPLGSELERLLRASREEAAGGAGSLAMLIPPPTAAAALKEKPLLGRGAAAAGGGRCQRRRPC